MTHCFITPRYILAYVLFCGEIFPTVSNTGHLSSLLEGLQLVNNHQLRLRSSLQFAALCRCGGDIFSLPPSLSFAYTSALWVVWHNAGSVWAAIPQGFRGTADLIKRFLQSPNLEELDQRWLISQTPSTTSSRATGTLPILRTFGGAGCRGYS